LWNALLRWHMQILTHIKEKLQFVEKENASLAQDLAGVEAQLAARREELQATKTQRDKLRERGRRTKDRSVFVTQSALLGDMEVSCLSCLWTSVMWPKVSHPGEG
jgi:predicted nuclease with TOPRIM domain